MSLPETNNRDACCSKLADEIMHNSGVSESDGDLRSKILQKLRFPTLSMAAQIMRNLESSEGNHKVRSITLADLGIGPAKRTREVPEVPEGPEGEEDPTKDEEEEPRRKRRKLRRLKGKAATPPVSSEEREEGEGKDGKDELTITYVGGPGFRIVKGSENAVRKYTEDAASREEEKIAAAYPERGGNRGRKPSHPPSPRLEGDLPREPTPRRKVPRKNRGRRLPTELEIQQAWEGGAGYRICLTSEEVAAMDRGRRYVLSSEEDEEEESAPTYPAIKELPPRGAAIRTREALDRMMKRRAQKKAEGGCEDEVDDDEEAAEAHPYEESAVRDGSGEESDEDAKIEGDDLFKSKDVVEDDVGDEDDDRFPSALPAEEDFVVEDEEDEGGRSNSEDREEEYARREGEEEEEERQEREEDDMAETLKRMCRRGRKITGKDGSCKRRTAHGIHLQYLVSYWISPRFPRSLERDAEASRYFEMGSSEVARVIADTRVSREDLWTPVFLHLLQSCPHYVFVKNCTEKKPCSKVFSTVECAACGNKIFPYASHVHAHLTGSLFFTDGEWPTPLTRHVHGMGYGPKTLHLLLHEDCHEDSNAFHAVHHYDYFMRELIRKEMTAAFPHLFPGGKNPQGVPSLDMVSAAKQLLDDEEWMSDQYERFKTTIRICTDHEKRRQAKKNKNKK